MRSYSYLIDNNDRTIKEVVTVKATGEKKALEYSSIGHNFNGYESVISAGGGAGCGGGGSGASTSASAIGRYPWQRLRQGPPLQAHRVIA